MKTASAKAKGRRAAKEVSDLLYKYAPKLQEGDIVVTPSGVTGADIQLSPLARTEYNFAIECKNQESLNIWKSFEQACEHTSGKDYTPVLFYKRNRSELMVSLKAEDFLKLIKTNE